MADYEVTAELELDAKKTKTEAAKAAKAILKINRELEQTRSKGQQALGAVGSAFRNIGSSLRGTNLGVGRMVTGLVGIGATYVGVRSIGNAIRNIATMSGQANASVETLKLSLGTIMAETEGISFESAQQQAGGLYRQMQDIAIASPGTAAEIADVFTSTLGPMRRAGQSMDDILRLSQNTLSVASALRIDLPQVSRDISMMATGVAGTDVKTFRLLRSMGLITKTTREWNEMALANPTAAAEELTRIFEQLGGPAAEAFGNTWAGVSSAFGDLVENFSRVLGTATFGRVRDALKEVNEFLIRYRDNIERVLTVIGESIGGVFDRVWDSAKRTFSAVASNLDAIALKIDTAITKIREFLPAVKKIAMSMAVASIGMKVLGTALSGVGAVFAGLSGISGLAGMLGIAGGGAGAAATAVSGAGAAAGGTGISAALAAVGSAFMAVAPIVAGVAAVFAVVGASIYSVIDELGTYVSEIMDPIWGDLQEIGMNLMAFFAATWEFLKPIFVMIGAVLVSVFGTALRLAVSTIRGMTETLVWFGGVLERIGEAIGPPLREASEGILAFGRDISRFLSGPFRSFARTLSSFGLTVNLPEGGALQGAPTTEAPGVLSDLLAGLTDTFDGVPDMLRRPEDSGTGGVPQGRPTTNVDMRGSRIEVRQEFREADPDRIWMQFVEGMSREAVMRTQSGLLNPLTR